MVEAATSHHRIRFLVWFLGIVMALFVVRLFDLQIIKHSAYVEKAESEQVKSLVIHAKRGEIYALDNGTPVKMVLNENVYTVFADPVEVKDPDAVVKAVREVAGGTAEKGIEKLVRDKPYRYRIIAKNLSRKQAEMLRDKRISGVGLQEATRRVYPEASLAAQTLGFVNAEDKGQYGVEEALDDQLRGKDGMLRSVTDVRNVPLTIGNNSTRIPKQDGKDIVLSIDRNVQAYTQKTLAKQMKKIGATNGSALVMDPQTGKVLAMANLPTYNPEKFTSVRNAAAFNNAIITTPYEPGSVMKTFTVATGIDKGVITANSTYNNTDSIKVEDRTITNLSRGQTGQITIQHALNWSLNTGMVTVAERLGDGNNITRGSRDIIYDYFHNRFGLGQATGIELAGEVKGRVISPDVVEGNAVRYSNMTFGQGMDPTMIQVAAGFSSIVNGGKYYQPTVIAGEMRDDEYVQRPTPKPLRQTISPSASNKARKMVHDARAAFYSKTDKKGYDIGGKTGTSQTLINNSYDNNQTIGTYLGYGGDDKPKYVIMVQVSAPGKGFAGTDAMLVFNDVSNWLIDYMKLQPKG
ncbi:MAG TPA: penicillin-binding protein 2 [Candidatus Saccharimonadales bacterium]